jgi:hypothetical protein
MVVLCCSFYFQEESLAVLALSFQSVIGLTCETSAFLLCLCAELTFCSIFAAYVQLNFLFCCTSLCFGLICCNQVYKLLWWRNLSLCYNVLLFLHNCLTLILVVLVQVLLLCTCQFNAAEYFYSNFNTVMVTYFFRPKVHLVFIMEMDSQFKVIITNEVYLSEMISASFRPWRPIGLWDVKDPTLYRQYAHRWRQGCQPYALAPLSSPETFFCFRYLFLLEAE